MTGASVGLEREVASVSDMSEAREELEEAREREEREEDDELPRERDAKWEPEMEVEVSEESL